jgi:hypothetical protein
MYKIGPYCKVFSTTGGPARKTYKTEELFSKNIAVDSRLNITSSGLTHAGLIPVVGSAMEY